MSKTYIGVEPMLERTLQVLFSDPSVVPAPSPRYWKDENGRIMGIVYGPVERPDFVIDEAELPY
jgi:hypothetical protein